MWKITTMKSTLTNSTDLNTLSKIRELVQDYPNDMELGGKVRQLLWKPKPHFPSKKQREEWSK